ncbi:MAG: hypothetical protein KPI85_08170 [cyanobacterium endosymbiont of Epithemia adnata isolate EadnSB Bon19]|jgi:hypothetical protein
MKIKGGVTKIVFTTPKVNKTTTVFCNYIFLAATVMLRNSALVKTFMSLECKIQQNNLYNYGRYMSGCLITYIQKRRETNVIK